VPTGQNPHEEAAAAAQEPAGESPQVDQLVSSITRLSAHLGNKGKFRKASGLFRRLLDSGQLDRSHGKHVMEVRANGLSLFLCGPGRKQHNTAGVGWQALRMAMADASNVEDPALRLDYRALFQTVDEHAASILSKPDREQVAVWVLRTVLQNQLHTDDNYEVRVGLPHVGQSPLTVCCPAVALKGVSVMRRQFNKVVAEVRQHIERLPPWEPFQAPVDVDSQPPPPPGTQHATVRGWVGGGHGQSPFSSPECRSCDDRGAVAGPPPAPPPVSDTTDPFGLEQLLPSAEAEAAATAAAFAARMLAAEQKAAARAYAVCNDRRDALVVRARERRRREKALAAELLSLAVA